MPTKKLDTIWLEFAAKVFALGRDIFEQARYTETKEGAKDPRAVALAILARTMNAFEAAIILQRGGHIVEARNLVRSCYEDAFYIEALASKGKVFVEEMIAHHIASRKDRGEFMLAWSAGKRLDPVIAQKLKAHLKSEKNKESSGLVKPRILHMASFAKRGLLQDAYHIYAQLCEDAAHVNIESISRHIKIKRRATKTDITVSAIATLRPKESLETLDFACGAMLPTCVGVNQMVGGTPAGVAMRDLWNEYKALQKKYQKPTRGTRRFLKRRARRG
jgi:hypothetical protein